MKPFYLERAAVCHHLTFAWRHIETVDVVIIMRKTISLLVVVMVLMSLIIIPVSATSSFEALTGSALWIEQFDSFSELSEVADVVFEGSVKDQYTELRDDLVFTRSNIEINTVYTGDILPGENIEIVQTGGVYGEYSNPEIEDAPIVENGENYIFFLRYVNDSTYGEYYLILGGGQGLVDSSDTEMATNATTSTIHDLTSYLDSEKSLTAATDTVRSSASVNATTPSTGGYFYTKSPKIYYRSTVTSTLKTNARNAVTSWNDGYSTTGVTISTTTNASSADITVSAGSYGDTDWVGYTWRYNSSGDAADEVDVYYEAYIGLNTDLVSSSSSNWKIVVAHEIGHVFGLKDVSTSVSYKTIMLKEYDSLISSGISAPTTADYNGVKATFS